jgi:hypothetical protein
VTISVSPALQKALEAVEAIPRRPWDESDADSPSARSARAYNSGLWDARSAIKKLIHDSQPVIKETL